MDSGAAAGLNSLPVILVSSRDAAAPPAHQVWSAVGAGALRLDPARRVPGLAAALEAAFEAIAEEWWHVGRALAADPSAGLAHAPACVANASDFGLMLAWTRLVDDWAAASGTTLVVCDDPWLFRHLAPRPGVCAGRAPGIIWPTVKLFLRGYVARIRLACVLAGTALRMRPGAPTVGGAALLVYGHPASTAEGDDAYFGDLMRRMPALRRILHVDCLAARARTLRAAGRTESLHGWGRVGFALFFLPFARWRPAHAHLSGPVGWLVRRAAAREGGTGQPAMIRWQTHCQKLWLAAARPRIVAWPWENHSWERALVRAARAAGCATVGYQHSVIGRHMLNYAPHSNPDGVAGLPDRILCSGPATRDQLAAWTIPAERLEVGGALRFSAVAPVRHAPYAPVFVALPFDSSVAAEMVAAARAATARGWKFIIRDHPMMPFSFAESPGLARAGDSLAAQASVMAVVFAATTVGLEAILMGLPVLRFRSADRISIDILPVGIHVPTTGAESLSDDLAGIGPPPAIARAHVFAQVDHDLWARELAA